MSILDDMLVAVPGDADVQGIAVGPRAVAVASRCVGLASMLPGSPAPVIPPPYRDACAGARGDVAPQALLGASGRASALQLAREVSRAAPEQVALGLAALNSLLPPPPPELQAGNAVQLLLARGAGQRVAVVGRFPFVARLRPRVRQLWVLELAPEEGEYPAEAAADILPRADVVALTGCTLVSQSMDRLLALARGAFVVVLGPSTPLSPLLFRRGVDVLGGMVVDQPARVLQQVAAGVSYRQLEGARRVIWQREQVV